MDLHARLAVLRQDLERLLILRDPDQVQDWQPSETVRVVYVHLLDRILDGVDEYRRAEKRQVLRDGQVQIDVSDSALAFYRNELEPRIPILKQAYKTIDPGGSELYLLLDGLSTRGGPGSRIRDTFEEGIQQIYNLIDRNPDQDFGFLPDTASEFLDSKLVSFDPDAWLDRAGHLAPVRTERNNVLLPVHVRFRLEEAFRAYVFGCWLSVLTLARAILEYSILDNLYKFGIDDHWPQDRDGKRRAKKLEHLIDDVGLYLPDLVERMDRLRTYGNEYLHPKSSRISKESLFQREKAAKHALETITSVTEVLYRTPKHTSTHQ